MTTAPPPTPKHPRNPATASSAPDVPSALFVCVGNSCRSQMAEAFARRHGLTTASAGTEPAESVSSRAAAAMGEVGLSLATHSPKTLADVDIDSFDAVITMGCGVAESCPSLVTDEDWGLDDPVHADMEVVRKVRDDIERRVLDLQQRLLAGSFERRRRRV